MASLRATERSYAKLRHLTTSYDILRHLTTSYDILRRADSRSERAFFTVGVFRRDSELGNFTCVTVTKDSAPRDSAKAKSTAVQQLFTIHTPCRAHLSSLSSRPSPSLCSPLKPHHAAPIRLQLGSKPLMTCPPPRANSLAQKCCRLCMAVLEQKHSRSSYMISTCSLKHDIGLDFISRNLHTYIYTQHGNICIYYIALSCIVCIAF